MDLERGRLYVKAILVGIAIVMSVTWLMPDAEWFGAAEPATLSIEVKKGPFVHVRKHGARGEATTEGGANYEASPSIGDGGAQVLFLPCKVDGYWSNVRQVVASVYMARRFNLTYVDQDLFFKFQDTGRISGVRGPISVFEVFDRKHMDLYFRTASQDEFWEGPALQSPIRSNISYAGIDQGVRCEIRTSHRSLEKHFLRWLNLYKIGKSKFVQNKYTTRPEQWKLLESLSWMPPSRKFILSGTPRFEEVIKDYQLTAIYRTRQDLPKFFLESFEAIQFAPHIRALQARARELLGIEANEKFIAVHIRRGNTFGIGGKSGQAKVDDVVDAVLRAKECIGEPVNTIFISTLRPYLKKETDILQAAFPDDRVVTVGVNDVTWEMLEPGLGEKNTTITRAAVEMQFWFAADAFVGSRSTMSSFIQVMRIAHRTGDACNRFSQKAWAEAESGKPVP